MTEEQLVVHYTELARMRGEIIAGFANIESGICKCITAYFIDPTLETTKSMEFLFEFLYHDFLNFKIKKDMFENICDTKGIKKFPFNELIQLQKIRNKFAHSWAINFDNGNQKLALFGEFYKKDAKTLYEEYKVLFKKIEDALTDALKDEKWYGRR